MEKLKALIEQHRRWQPLEDYVRRIEALIENDFSTSLENAKSLLETICKEICDHHKVDLGKKTDFGPLLKKTFNALGYDSNNFTTQVSSSLSNIAGKMGELRNALGKTGHGRSLRDLEIIEESNRQMNEFTKEFFIDSTVLVACFLIRNFERDNPSSKKGEEKPLLYDECQTFNQAWDDLYGEFAMGNYSFQASEILFNVDNKAYTAEYQAYVAEPPEL